MKWVKPQAGLFGQGGSDEAKPPKEFGRRGVPGAEAFVPHGPRVTLAQMSEAAQGCRGCDLYRRATQAVFGKGPVPAVYMLIGEVPGDQEDVQGEPFVGPAGQLLRRAMEDAGIGIEETYLTNAVKHFKWVPAPRGKRRIHSKPNGAEVYACKPWLEREIEFVKPRAVVLLGATAAQSLLGAQFRVTRERGRIMTETPWGRKVLATVHPSSLLRAPEDADREAMYAEFVGDLRKAKAAAK